MAGALTRFAAAAGARVEFRWRRLTVARGAAREQREPGGATPAGGTGGWAWDSGSGGSTGGTGGATPSGGTGGTTGDGGWPVDPALWKTPAWNPPGCNFLQATEPVKAVPATPWVACDNGVAGCQLLETSLVPGEKTAAHSKFGALNNARRQNGSTYFSGVLMLGTYDHAATVYALDATPLAVWRAPDTLANGCTVAESTFGEHGGVSSRFRYRVVVGESAVRIIYGELPALLGPNPSYLDMDKSVTGLELFTVNHVRFSSTMMALYTGLNPHVYVWPYSGTPTQIPKPADVSEQHSPIVIGSEVVFTRYGSPTSTGFAVRRANGNVDMLHTKPTAWAAKLRKDDANYVWQELTDTGILELWTSPLTKPVTAFQPKLVRVVESASGSFVGAAFGEGWWVYRKDIDTLRAVRISDGHWVDMPPPKDKGWIEPFAVVEGEVWANVQHVPGTANGVSSIVRVPIASLGAPKP
ncbi:MAG: hypothetical protein KF718_03780 [Polyangiaceae bacterium]|nr:hypothetical protein [Polyangiaceae bacterium]